METNFNFESSVCTSIEQSRTLLALGLRKETADMSIVKSIIDGYIIITFPPQFEHEIPAWSLHRLIEMIDDECVIQLSNFSISGHVFVKHNNLYDNIIDCIEWLIKEGYFNKKYLNGTAEN